MNRQNETPANPPQTYQADIVVPATEDTPGRLVHVDLNAQETIRLQQIADRCGWSLGTLIRKHVSEGLPRHVELLLGIDLRRGEDYTEPTLREQRGEVPRTRQLSPGCEEAWATKLPLASEPLPPPQEYPVFPAPVLAPLTLTLSSRATIAVLRYHHVTGDNLNDIVDGVVVRELENALGCVADREQNAWTLTAKAIAEAAFRRIEWQATDPQDGLTGFEHTVILSLAPAAHALLQTISLNGGHGSVEGLIRDLCMTECRRFAEAITDPQRPVLDLLFNNYPPERFTP